MKFPNSAVQMIDPTIELLDPDGGIANLAQAHSHPYLVVQLGRYFGCLPCQDWLIGLDRMSADLSARGAAATAVGGSADYQARWLRDERDVSMPLFLDPEHAFSEAVDMTAPLGMRRADPRGIGAYVASLAHGNRPQRITRDTVRSPGVVILDRNIAVVWRHEGVRIGDYPTHATVLDALDGMGVPSL